jgi:hypothetical protein
MIASHQTVHVIHPVMFSNNMTATHCLKSKTTLVINGSGGIDSGSEPSELCARVSRDDGSQVCFAVADNRHNASTASSCSLGRERESCSGKSVEVSAGGESDETHWSLLFKKYGNLDNEGGLDGFEIAKAARVALLSSSAARTKEYPGILGPVRGA